MIFGILADKFSLQRFYFIYQKYGWTGENGTLNLNLHFKGNAPINEHGNAKLALSILAAVNGSNSCYHLNSTR